MPDRQPPEVEAVVAQLEAATVAVEQATLALDNAKAELHRIKTQVAPEVFNRLGITRASTPSGASAKATTIITGSLPNAEEEPEARERAIEHALALHWEDFIESAVTAKWGRGEREQALAEFRRLQAINSASVKLVEGIHHSTLKACVRRGLSQGLPMDLDVLGVTVLPGVTLTRRSPGSRTTASATGDDDGESRTGE